MKKIIETILYQYVRLLVRLHSPQVIAVTGSVGKTTVLNYIGRVLEDMPGFAKRTGSYNSEIGLPLYILNLEAPSQVKNPFAWLAILIKGFVRTLMFSDKILVLEMGADHPGDIAYLCSMVRPDIGVVTAAHNVHSENFDADHSVLNEKMVMAEQAGTVILNFDEDNLVNAAEERGLEPIYFGTDTAVDSGVFVDGDSFTLQLKGELERPFKTGVIGYPAQVAMAAAAAVGQRFGMEGRDIVDRLAGLTAPAGRMQPLKGKLPGVLVLDDSYNASEKAVVAALNTLQSQKKVSAKTIAILGSMNELGDISEESHRAVGRAVAERDVDHLITIGKMSNDWLASEAIASGMDSAAVQSFMSPIAAGKAANDLAEKDDVILGKGSQNGVFAEEALKQVIDPAEISKLVRQQEFWLNKKRSQFEDMSE